MEDKFMGNNKCQRCGFVLETTICPNCGWKKTMVDLERQSDHIEKHRPQTALYESIPIDTDLNQKPRPTLYGCLYPEVDRQEKLDTERKIVGVLITYSHFPMGKVFNIYEGRNFIGRDAYCEISVPDDYQMSWRHMLIRYLTGDGKFRFRDEKSAIGTFVNNEQFDEGELHNFDIIQVGNTRFIFIAIPQAEIDH